MIVFTLRCAEGHTFDEWFPSSGAYAERAEAGDIACPHCGTRHVEKTLTAPRLNAGAMAPTPPCGAPACGAGVCQVTGEPFGR